MKREKLSKDSVHAPVKSTSDTATKQENADAETHEKTNVC